jgi:hypothetical protein
MQLRTNPLMSYRGRSVRHTVHIVSTILVCSYIFFDVLDLDGSDFPRFLRPVQKTIIVALVASEAELFNSPKPLVRADSTLIPITDEAARFTSPQQAKLLILSSLFSARAHGYRVSLARNFLSDSSPYH